MKKYRVDMLRVQCLDSRTVEADSPEKAQTQALITFNKFDVDDYDALEVTCEDCGCKVLEQVLRAETDVCECE